MKLELDKLRAENEQLRASVDEYERVSPLDIFPSPDVEGIQTELNGVDKYNQLVRYAIEYNDTVAKGKDKRAEYEDGTAKLCALDEEKNAALAAAELPIDGLGVTDDGVTYNDIPFDQLSSAEQLRVSLAMAMALNPKLRVIRITDGSLLDSNSLQIIQDMIREKDFQLWLETVDESGEVGFVIEDGAVVQANKTA